MKNALIQKCPLRYRCPRLWNELEETEVDSVRFCNECERDVFLCLTEESYQKAIEQGLCVALQSEVEEELVLGMPETVYGAPADGQV